MLFSRLISEPLIKDETPAVRNVPAPGIPNLIGTPPVPFSANPVE